MAIKNPLVISAVNYLVALVQRRATEMSFAGARRHETAEVCLMVVGLMQDLQLHRALSGAVLDGQSGFGEPLHVNELKLSRSLCALSDQYGDGHPVFRRDEWRAVLSHWESVQGNWRELDFYTNLFVHSELVVHLVEVLRLLSNEYGDRLCADHDELIRHWPMLIEQLGILRALGVYWLGRQPLARDERVAKSMSEYLRYANSELKRVSKIVMNAQLRKLTDAALRLVGDVLEGTYDPDPQTYYGQMTEVIDTWYRTMTMKLAARH